VLPKSVTPARIETNFTGALSAAAKLDAADIKELDGLAAAGKQKRCVFVCFLYTRIFPSPVFQKSPLTPSIPFLRRRFITPPWRT